VTLKNVRSRDFLHDVHRNGPEDLLITEDVHVHIETSVN